ncbi:MAG: mechanosensitive ion channel family protein [Rhizobiaceae bacterium]|nr:mechanosensitive ion channel family protein [Rhizobiaceae bacterium]MCV0406596.1 mechanosensitive ion channel family protein [Rhizobiaceae bacterium]
MLPARVSTAKAAYEGDLRFLTRLLLHVVLAALVWFQAPAPLHAQEPASLVQRQEATIDRLALRSEELTRAVQAAAENDERLVELRLELEQLARELLEASVRFRPRLAEINARLEQIGAPPIEGQPPEPAVVAEERRALNAEKAEINALIGKAESTSIRANQLVDTISTMRRDLFANTLSKRYDLDFALGGDALEELGVEAVDVWNAFASWARHVVRFKLTSALMATLLAALCAVVLLVGGRRLFGGLITADPLKEEPSYLSRLSVAFWATLLPALAFAVFLFSGFYFFDFFDIYRPDIRAVMLSLVTVVSVVFFVHRLAAAVLSPKLPNWRLVGIGSRPASMLLWLVSATAAITGLDALLNQINEVFGSPLSLSVAKSLVATVLVGVFVILIGLVKPYQDEDGGSVAWPGWLRAVLFILGGATIAAALLGYIGLARFVSQQIVVTGAIAATMYIGFLSANAISQEGAFAHTALGRRLEERFKFDETTTDQIGLVVSIAANVLIILLGLPLILFQWGFQWGDIQGWIYRLAQGVTIGTITISPLGIFSGILVFIIGYFLTRGFQGWLDGKVMARGRMDAGVRNSIRTAVGYAGIALAALIGVSAAGIDLSSLALVAGALSLGIGFGLQNVVSNFVSGLILLAERPFKAGDWIVAGGVEGTVKKINVRATEIETFQRQTVILPNSDLINSAVGNWTHKNKLGRVEVPVGVAYGTDVRKVHTILTEIVTSHPLALKNPEPFVLFANFGESSLDFEVRVFLADISNTLLVKNDLRFAILERFTQEGIEIPFAQRDLHLKSADGVVIRTEAAPKPAPARSRRRPKQA